jgi:hypothetical protein
VFEAVRKGLRENRSAAQLTLSMARANPDELIRETSQKATELES